MKANECDLELTNKLNEVLEEFKSELETQKEKDLFENATMNYDYLYNEGVIFRDINDLFNSCIRNSTDLEEEDFEKELQISDKLKQVFTKYIVAFHTIYYMGYDMFGNGILEIVKEYLTSQGCEFNSYYWKIDEKADKIIWNIRKN